MIANAAENMKWYIFSAKLATNKLHELNGTHFIFYTFKIIYVIQNK